MNFRLNRYPFSFYLYSCLHLNVPAHIKNEWVSPRFLSGDISLSFFTFIASKIVDWQRDSLYVFSVFSLMLLASLRQGLTTKRILHRDWNLTKNLKKYRAFSIHRTSKVKIWTSLRALLRTSLLFEKSNLELISQSNAMNRYVGWPY